MVRKHAKGPPLDTTGGQILCFAVRVPAPVRCLRVVKRIPDGARCATGEAVAGRQTARRISVTCAGELSSVSDRYCITLR